MFANLFQIEKVWLACTLCSSHTVCVCVRMCSLKSMRERVYVRRESIYRFQLIRFNFSFSLLLLAIAQENTIQRLIQYFTSIMSWHKQPRKHINFEVFFFLSSFSEAEYLMEDFVSYPVLNLPPLCTIIIATIIHASMYVHIEHRTM